jgi:CHAT domain-containing protein/lipopolysaccharide biosynthesis regulator YciM
MNCSNLKKQAVIEFKINKLIWICLVLIFGCVHTEEAKSSNAEKLTSLTNLVQKLNSENDTPSLVRLYKKNIDTLLKSEDSSEIIELLSIFSNALEQKKEFQLALKLRKRILEVIETTLGTEQIEFANALFFLGRTYVYLGQYESALDFQERALSIYEEKKGRDHLSTSFVLSNLAGTHTHFNQHQQALELFFKSLKIREQVLQQNDVRIANLLDKIANSYVALGEPKNAYEMLQRSLEIRELQIEKENLDLAVTINNLAMVQIELGLFDSALPMQIRALEITERVLGRTHEDTARCLLNIAQTRNLLGQHEHAIALQKRALKIYQELFGYSNSYSGIAMTHLANSYLSVKDFNKAIALQKRGLEILEKKLGPSHPRVASAVNNLGSAYWGHKDFAKALPLLKRNLQIKRKTLGLIHLSTALAEKNLASIYVKLKRFDEGYPLLINALATYESILGSDHQTTIEAYVHLLDYLPKKPSEYSVTLLKQHVNSIQTTRNRISQLGSAELKSYTERYKSTYQTLAFQLIELGRLTEAQQVLEMLKEDEYFEFIQRSLDSDPRKSKSLYSANETKWIERYSQIANQLSSLNAEERDLNKLSKNGLSTEQIERQKKLGSEKKVARLAFERYLIKLREEISKKPATKSLYLADTSSKSTNEIQSLIQNLGHNVALVQYFITDDQIGILLTTPSIQIARSSKINSKKLKIQISEFLSTLRNPAKKSLKNSQSLYKLLFAPIESVLVQEKIETIMISLDGALRYIPIGALHDGKNYASQRWSMAIYNPVVKEKLFDLAEPKWNAVGLGLTKSTLGFSSLPGVEPELRSIIKDDRYGKNTLGLIPGEVYLNSEFTSKLLFDVSLRPFQLLHIASHFRFSPGTEENSFLLLGDGSQLSLKELRKSNIRFNNLEMLTLSACETGLGGGVDADGKEIEGLGVLVQKQGAKSVLSTLWSVSDESSVKFMTDMYHAKIVDGLSKSDAIRKAQKIMLSEPRFSHPFYWAPYVLMGNWK